MAILLSEKITMLENTEAGLYCRAADFHIDPWRPVGRAVITHVHACHARPGCCGPCRWS